MSVRTAKLCVIIVKYKRKNQTYRSSHRRSNTTNKNVRPLKQLYTTLHILSNIFMYKFNSFSDLVLFAL